MKVLTALPLIFLFAITAAAAPDCTEPTIEILPQCRGTVMIETPSETGAGVVIGYADDGVFVLTARHVVKDDKPIMVKFHDKKYVSFPARMERESKDEVIDLAVIKVFPTKSATLPRDLPTFKVREEVRSNEEIFIISYRDGQAWQRDSTKIRAGNVEADQRRFLYANENQKLGSSGGPVFDTAGSLLGIVYDQHNGSDGAGLKISQVWVWLQEKSYASLLKDGAVPPVNTGRPSSHPATTISPTITVELRSILVPANSDAIPAGWGFQVFIGEEEKIPEGKPLFNELIPVPAVGTRPPYALNLSGKKKEVTLTREDRLLVKIVATGPDARHSVQAQAPLDFSNQYVIDVGLTTHPSAPTRDSSGGHPWRDRRSAWDQAHEKDSFTFYLTLTKVKVSLAIDKSPRINTIEKLTKDLNALIAEGEKTAKEADIVELRLGFGWWRMRSSIVLSSLDDILRVLRWKPMMPVPNGRTITFREGFEEKTGPLSESVENLERDKVLRRIEDGVQYLNTVIFLLRDTSPERPPRSVKTDDQQTRPATAASTEPPWLWLSGGTPATQCPAAAPDSLARRWRR